MIWLAAALAQDAPAQCAQAFPLASGKDLDAWIASAAERVAVQLQPGVYPIAADLSHLDALVICGAAPGVLLTSDETAGTIRGPIVDLTLHQVALSNGNGPALDVQLTPGGAGVVLSRVTVGVGGVNPAVRIQGSGQVRVSDAVFSGGTAYLGAHLSLLGAVEPLEVHVERSSFVGGLATSRGGAIFADPQTSLTLEDSDFIDNRASSGGAVAAIGGLTVFGGSFEGNEADCQGPCGPLEGRGGAILASGGEIELSGMASFVDNAAQQHGGALSLNAAGVHTLRDLTLCRNSAVELGGGVHLAGDQPVSMGALRIIENQARQGGGVYGNARLDRSNLLGNQATELGAAMAGRGDEPSVLSFSIAAWNTGSSWVDAEQTDVRGNVAVWQNAGLDSLADDDETDAQEPYPSPAFRGYQPGRGDCDVPVDFVSVASSSVVFRGNYDAASNLWGTCPGEPDTVCVPSTRMYGAYGVYASEGEAAVSNYEVAWQDVDGDGWPAIFDCADGDPLVDPVTVFNDLGGFDTDCDGVVDLDFDGDGSLPPDDCDDNDARIHPGAERTPAITERYLDIDCDGKFEDEISAYAPRAWSLGCRHSGSLLPLFPWRR